MSEPTCVPMAEYMAMVKQRDELRDMFRDLYDSLNAGVHSLQSGVGDLHAYRSAIDGHEDDSVDDLLVDADTSISHALATLKAASKASKDARRRLARGE